MRLPYMYPVDLNGQVAADPLSHFKASDLDAAGDPSYYGFVAADGAWYILKTSSGGNVLRYASGAAAYTTAWTNRASLGYDYFDLVF